MNLLLFPIEHQNPGHQKMIQHTLQHYFVESLAILASTNCWGNAMKCQMEATWVWGKGELCIDESDSCKLGPWFFRHTACEQFNLLENPSHSCKWIHFNTSPRNNNFTYVSNLFRVRRTSHACQITDMLKYSQNQDHVLGV